MGPTCNIGIIQLPSVPVLRQGQLHNITISTDLDIQSKVAILLYENSTPKRPTIILTSMRKKGTLPFMPNNAGVKKITHTYKPTNMVAVQPIEFSIFVKEASDFNKSEHLYFTSLDIRHGQLKESCCNLPGSETLLSCTQNTNKVTLKAACQWENNETFYWAPGVVFAEGHNLSLPVSVAGYNYSRNGEASVYSTSSACKPCDSNMSVCLQQNQSVGDCYCYNFTGSDTQDFLNTLALGLTYMERIQMLLPHWLRLWVDLNHTKITSHYSLYDYLAPVVLSHSDISAIHGCDKISALSPGVYSVLRHDKTLSAEINGNTYTYIVNSTTDSDNPMCFVVNICQGMSSPVFIQFSQPVQNILLSEYLHSFSTKGWRIGLNTAYVSKPQPHNFTMQEYWNGIRMVSPSPINGDLTVNADIEAVLSSQYLNVTVEFIGDATLQYQVRVLSCMVVLLVHWVVCLLQERSGILNGQTVLRVNMLLGNGQFLYLSSQGESYISIKGNIMTCISFH